MCSREALQKEYHIIHLTSLSPRQSHFSWKSTKSSLEHLHTILVHRTRNRTKQALLEVFLSESHRTSYGITDIDWSQVVKVHLCSKETNHAANMRNHATCKQTRNNPTPKPATLNECLINMIGVIIPRHTAKERNIPLRKSALKSENLSLLNRIKSRS